MLAAITGAGLGDGEHRWGRGGPAPRIDDQSEGMHP